MRTKTPFRRKRLISRGSSSSTSVEVKVERELQCSRCKAIFPDYLARCPECGSEEWIGLVEVNPYTRMPMETFLKACGHLLWLVGTIGFLVLLCRRTARMLKPTSCLSTGRSCCSFAACCSPPPTSA